MDSSLNKVDKRYDAYNMAVKIAMQKFIEIHQSVILPHWFYRCTTISGTRSVDKKWLIRITVVPNQPLKPNQRWEEIDGSRVIVSTDLKTGKERIVLHREADTVEILYEAEVDLINGSATVITDTELELLDGSKYEICDC